ncbi:hypothetical protein SLE2022_128450 [Rubroshorea leprosula]
MEDVGYQCFHDLLSRAFFEQSNRDKSRFVIHDLIHDLAQYVAGEILYKLDHMWKGEMLEMSFERVRHCSFYQRICDKFDRFHVLDKLKSLRTFLPLYPFDHHIDCYISNSVLHNFLPKLTNLRVLSLSGYCIMKLPESVGDLKQLRYINLSHTEIQSIPRSVGFLVYLQSLILHNCKKLAWLPTTIGNLRDLHHLDITDTPSLQEMPLQVGNLIRLLTLPKFIVSKADGLRLRDLRNLSLLRGHLSLLELHNVLDVQDVMEVNFDKIEGLDDVALEWTSDFLNPRDESQEMLVLSQLKPHQNLKGLTISCYAGVAFPSWMGDPSYSNLLYLELRHCQRSSSLPSLGQIPSLKELIISGMHEMERMGPEFYGDNLSSPIGTFPSLEKLKLEDCPKLTRKLPGLLLLVIKLEIVKCPSLTYSPVSLPSLQELYVQTCNEAVLKSLIDLTSLTTLRINGISKLPCLPKSFTQSMIVVEAMEIKECDEFTSLWEEGTSIENLARLGSIKVENCPVLVSLAREEQGLLPYNLRHLIFKKCQALETLPDEMMMLEGCKRNMLRLEELSIKDCSSLTSFPPGKLPTSLKSLKITSCKKLECLPEGLMNGVMPYLENLKIRGLSLKNF